MNRFLESKLGTFLTILLVASSSLLGGCIAEAAPQADDVEQAQSALTPAPEAASEEAEPPAEALPAQVGATPISRPGTERSTDPQPDPWTGGFTDSARDPQPDPWQPKTVKTK